MRKLVRSGRNKIAREIINTQKNVLKSKRILFSQVLNILQINTRDEEHLYYPLQLDFRSRVYCVPAFLNYQSVGGAKALIEFANGKPITKKTKATFGLQYTELTIGVMTKFLADRDTSGLKKTKSGLLLVVKTH